MSRGRPLMPFLSSAAFPLHKAVLLSVAVATHCLAVSQELLGRVDLFEKELARGVTGNGSTCAGERRSVMFMQERVEGARQVLRGNSSFLPLWAPPEGRYLLVVCRFGQASNRLLCLRHHMILAGLLNRTLVLDMRAPKERDLTLGLFLDPQAARVCFGDRAVVGLGELLQRTGQRQLQVDAHLCATSMRGLCLADNNDLLSKPVVEMFDVARGMDIDRMQQWYAQWDNMTTLVIGDVGRYKIDPRHFVYGDVPFQRLTACKHALGMLPPHLLVSLAWRYVQEQFGQKPFMGVHWRQGDFLEKYCSGKADAPQSATICLQPNTVAQCLISRAVALGVQHVLLCSNAAQETLVSVQEQFSKKGIQVTLNPFLPDEGKELLGKRHEGNAEYVKLILALSYAFTGTEHSTFSADVERLRIGLGKETCMDFLICEGTPFTINENEAMFNNLL